MTARKAAGPSSRALYVAKSGDTAGKNARASVPSMG